MAISYPINTPTNIGIANITLMAENATAISQSPFTYQQQVVAHQGQRWAASISLPPMKRQDAENWIAFLLSLKGQVGTFLLGDPNGVAAQGAATARRNLFTNTEQFEAVFWSKVNTTVVANNTIAPNGQNTADKLDETAVSGEHYIQVQSAAVTLGQNYTFSVYVKAAERTRVQLLMAQSTTPFTGHGFVNFNLATQQITSSGNGGVAMITSVGNGWFRLTLAGIATTTSAEIVRIALLNDVGTNNYAGVANSGLFIWGAQFEVGSVATAYQGVVSSYGPFVNGVGQTGNTLNLSGCSPDVTDFFKAGDYIQIGAGATAQLYKVLTQTNTDGSGLATVDIWPNLRSSPANNSTVIVADTKGRFRLKENIAQWSINEISSYGITFDCVEAL